MPHKRERQGVCATQKDQKHHEEEIVPIELLEEILSCGWLSSMSIQERNGFVASIALVSKTWLVALIRVTCRDVYIHSTSDLGFIRQQLTARLSLMFLPQVSPSQLCRTITRQIPLSGKIINDGLVLQEKSIRNMLFTFHNLSLPPNLQTLTVEYHHPSHSFPFSFSASVVQLHLEYTFEDCSHWLIDALLVNRDLTSRYLPWELPHFEHISTPINEDSTISIVKVLDSCPQLELVEEFSISMRILSSSRCVPDSCTIFHGAMSSFDACITSDDDIGPKTVRGSAPVLVLKKDGDRVGKSSIDLTNIFRTVHIFSYRNST